MQTQPCETCYGDLVEYFYHAYVQNSFTKAGKILRKPQSTVSRKIAQLERETKRTFFIRRPVLMRTSDADEFMQECADPAHHALQYIHARVPADQPAAVVNVGARDYIVEQHLTDVASELARATPPVRLFPRSGYREQFEAWLVEGAIHVAVMAVADPPPYGWLDLGEYDVVVLVPEDHPARDIDDLFKTKSVAEPLICPPPSDGTTECFLEYRKRCGISWPVTQGSNSTAAIPHFVSRGLALGPCVAIDRLIRRPGIRALPLPGCKRVKVGAAHVGNPSGPTRQFLGVLAEHARRFRETQAR